MHAVKRHDQSGPNSKLPLHTDQTQHLTVNIHRWCSRWSGSLSIPCIVFFAADKYLCSSDLFSLSLRDQLHFSHYFWLAPCFVFFPMTPYFFPFLSIAVCQKRKSSSSVCLMVRSAQSFFIFHSPSCFVFSELFSLRPPVLRLPLFQFVFPLLGKDARGLLSDGLLPGFFFFLSAKHPCILSCHEYHRNHFMPQKHTQTDSAVTCFLWIIGCLCAPHYNTVNLLSLLNTILGCFFVSTIIFRN